MKKIETWGGRSNFSYLGSVTSGTRIVYGSGYYVDVSKQHYSALLKHFNGMRVPCGTSRTSPPVGSLGMWLQDHVTKTAIASYVGAILIEEGYAQKEDKWIKFPYKM